VNVVLLGGAGPEFSYRALNRAFGHLQRGARLVAMHRGLYWRTSEGLQLDTGAFLAGLEQAAGTEAEVVGKPAPAFFAAALLCVFVFVISLLWVREVPLRKGIEEEVVVGDEASPTRAAVRSES